MPDRSVDFLLIGGGVAAASCARTLREGGADGSILVVGREADPPYDRPPLSKDYLRGSISRDDAMFEAAEWWDEQRIELLTRTSVMRLELEERVARLQSKEEVGFGAALIATGANVRRLRVDGSDVDGIHYLRAFGNADAIRADAEEADDVVLIGGSYIACEVAATLAGLGKRCSLLMQESVTLERHFGADVGRFVQRGLEERGVRLHGDDELERFEGVDGRVAKVVSKRGLELDAQCVVMGTGVVPDTMLARSAGLALGARGVACSSRLETSVERVYAAGDVAEYDSPLHGRPASVEHWDVAIEHGKTAALNMLGRDQPHEAVPYFWTDIGDWVTLEYVGLESGDPVTRGSIDDGDFTVFHLRDGQVVGAVTAGRSDDLDEARRLIRERATPDPASLADASSDLSSL